MLLQYGIKPRYLEGEKKPTSTGRTCKLDRHVCWDLNLDHLNMRQKAIYNAARTCLTVGIYNRIVKPKLSESGQNDGIPQAKNWL